MKTIPAQAPVPSTPSTPTPPVPDPGTRERPRLPAWARAVIPMLLLMPIALTVAVPMLIPGYAAASERRDDLTALVFAASTVLPLALYLLASWILVRRVDRKPFSALGLRFDRGALVGLLGGTAIAIAIHLAAYWTTESLGIVRTVDPAVMQEPYSRMSLLGLVVFVVARSFILQGIGEELLFRGYVLQTLHRQPIIAVLVAAIAFTVPHLASGGGQESMLERVIYLAMPFGLSISAGFLAIACRSVWAGVGIHGGIHVAVAIATALGFTAKGPGMWLTVGALHILVGVLVAALVPRSRWAEVRAAGPYARPAAHEIPGDSPSITR